MSRAMNLNATEAHVRAACAKHAAEITAIETLGSGGTRVVLATSDSAAILRRAYGNKVMTGAVQRQPTRLMRA